MTSSDRPIFDFTAPLRLCIYNLNRVGWPEPSWRSWLARQSHNLKVVSSSLTEGILKIFYEIFEILWQVICKYLTLRDVFIFKSSKKDIEERANERIGVEERISAFG